MFIVGGYVKYADVSRKIMEYLRTQTGSFEQASVDEAYLEISKFKNQNEKWEEAGQKAQGIKDHIKKIERLTCSIGIGPNKLIAKIAAGEHKPDGLTIIRPEFVEGFLDPKPVGAIPGIGPKARETLARIGVRTIAQLRAVPEEKLVEMFGKPRRTMNNLEMKSGSRPLRASGWGASMYRRSRGIDDSPVEEEREAKSVGEQETYERDTLDPAFLTAHLSALCQTVMRRLKQEGFNSFRTVSLIVRFENFETKTRSHTFQEPVAQEKVLKTAALQLFLPFLDRRENPHRQRIRLLGVRVEKLSTTKPPRMIL